MRIGRCSSVHGKPRRLHTQQVMLKCFQHQLRGQRCCVGEGFHCNAYITTLRAAPIEVQRKSFETRTLHLDEAHQSVRRQTMLATLWFTETTPDLIQEKISIYCLYCSDVNPGRVSVRERPASSWKATSKLDRMVCWTSHNSVAAYSGTFIVIHAVGGLLPQSSSLMPLLLPLVRGSRGPQRSKGDAWPCGFSCLFTTTTTTREATARSMASCYV